MESLARVELGMDSALACLRICDEKRRGERDAKDAARAYVKELESFKFLFRSNSLFHA